MATYAITLITGQKVSVAPFTIDNPDMGAALAEVASKMQLEGQLMTWSDENYGVILDPTPKIELMGGLLNLTAPPTLIVVSRLL